MGTRDILIPLPPAVQTTTYDCGASCLRAVCKYFGVGSDNENDYIDACNSDPDNGTKPPDLAAAARQMGLSVIARTNVSIKGLEAALRAGIPVVCAIQAWGGGREYKRLESGHYVVAIGIRGNHVYFQDPYVSGSRGKMEKSEFLKRWRDSDSDGRIYRQLGIAMWLPGGPKGEGSGRMRARRIK